MPPSKKHAKKKSSTRDKVEQRRPGTFPIVGIGASAGGMEAFSQILDQLPADTGMAIVFVQHLHPGYESSLTEILTRYTTMPVVEAADNLAVEPNHVYVIPPGSYLGIQNGVLQLLPRAQPHERRLPIDQFFRHLAADRGAGAIGVVLSATGSDGVLGVTEKETRENLVHRLGNGQWAIPRLRELLEKTACEGEEFNDFELTHTFEHIGEKAFLVSGRQIPAGLPEGPMVVMQIAELEPGNRPERSPS